MPQQPDYIAPVRTPMQEIQDRMGIPSIEELLRERDALVREIAPLRAKHGSFGTFDALRKITLSAAAVRIRAAAIRDSTKLTDATVDALSHSDEAYVQFVVDGTQEKARYFELENRVEGIADQINRGQAIARFLSAEVSLAR